MYRTEIPKDLKEQFEYAFQQIKKDRNKYFNWIKDEIEEAIALINKYDKIYVLGGLGALFLDATPNIYNHLMKSFNENDGDETKTDNVDEEIEVILEYAINIATATPNQNIGIIPTSENIEKIRNQLSKIKTNINLFEISNEISPDGKKSDQWLRSMTIQNSLNVRGEGYQNHVELIYSEIFKFHDEFLTQYYGFNSQEILASIKKFDSLIYSSIANELGGVLCHKRFVEWCDNNETDIADNNFIQLFTDDNPDLYDQAIPGKIALHELKNINGVNKIFRVIPQTENEQKIYDYLSMGFGDNTDFFEPNKFKAFPLNDSIINLKPLIKSNDEYFCFSPALPHRNAFRLTEHLIEKADAVYHQQIFRGNTAKISKDNYIEKKTKQIFESLLPNVDFYHSLKYSIIEDEIEKNTELDIIGIGENNIYIIEVKAGRLTTKHKRGALLGLKKRITDTINEGSYQCHRAEKYIKGSDNPVFNYIADKQSKVLTINKHKEQKYIKISVTFEHYSLISLNLKELIESEILNEDYKWTWIVSLLDLMVFSDIIENEDDFLDYIEERVKLYDRQDITFMDEIDILGFFLDGNFPLEPFEKETHNLITGHSKEIDQYYSALNLALPDIKKPKRKT